MMKYVLYVILNFLTLWTSILHAEVHIEITHRVDSARPIAVVPFQYVGSNHDIIEDIGDIIANDLRNSGKFNSLDSTHLPQYPNNIQAIQQTSWSTLGVNVIVMGQVIANIDGNYTITYQLVNISKVPSAVVSCNSYQVTKQWLRYVGHTISDEIFEKMTGIKGAFRTRIAYIVHNSNNPMPYELCVSDYDGYNRFVVHRSIEPMMSPAWSPKGDKLAYVTFESGRSALVMQTLASGVIQQIVSFPHHNGAPAFSPDGTKLAFALSKTGSLNIYVMDIDCGRISQITDNHNNNTEPTWFPDNQNLAYTSDQTGNPQIYKVNINNIVSPPQRITWEHSHNQNADISNDGKFMVMVNSHNGQQHIVKQDLITDSIQLLSSTSSLDETPSLAPNDTMVIYSSYCGTKSALNLVSTDGNFTARLSITDGQVSFPSWSPFL